MKHLGSFTSLFFLSTVVAAALANDDKELQQWPRGPPGPRVPHHTDPRPDRGGQRHLQAEGSGDDVSASTYRCWRGYLEFKVPRTKNKYITCGDVRDDPDTYCGHIKVQTQCPFDCGTCDRDKVVDSLAKLRYPKPIGNGKTQVIDMHCRDLKTWTFFDLQNACTNYDVFYTCRETCQTLESALSNRQIIDFTLPGHNGFVKWYWDNRLLFSDVGVLSFWYYWEDDPKIKESGYRSGLASLPMAAYNGQDDGAPMYIGCPGGYFQLNAVTITIAWPDKSDYIEFVGYYQGAEVARTKQFILQWNYAKRYDDYYFWAFYHIDELEIFSEDGYKFVVDDLDVTINKLCSVPFRDQAEADGEGLSYESLLD